MPLPGASRADPLGVSVAQGSGCVGSVRLLLVTPCPSPLKSFLPSTETVSGSCSIDLFSISMMIDLIHLSDFNERLRPPLNALLANEGGE
jgi:hypothetical protein